jgi:hypothetical protein
MPPEMYVIDWGIERSTGDWDKMPSTVVTSSNQSYIDELRRANV